jgi:hypothetical protein
MQQHNLTSRTRVPTSRRARIAVAAALVVVAALVAAACGSAGGNTNDGKSMSLDVVTPTSGATVGRSFHVEVRSNVPFAEPSTGEHHLHLYFDGVKTVGKYAIVYGKSTTVTTLSPGKHTIEAEIANPDHSGTGVTKTFTVNVGANGASGGTSNAPTTTSPSPGYGY